MTIIDYGPAVMGLVIAIVAGARVASPALAVPNGMALPAGVTYLVKLDLGSNSDLI